MSARTIQFRRGAAGVIMVMVLLLTQIVIVGVVISGARDQDLSVQRIDTTRSFYAAESGVNMAIRELRMNSDWDGDGSVGTISNDANASDDPAFGSARVSVVATTSLGLETLTATSRAGATRRRARAVMRIPSVAIFDGSGLGLGYVSFQALQAAYDTFMGSTDDAISFTGYPRYTIITNQYTASKGVTFSNSSTSFAGVYAENDANVEPLDGYDASYMPDSDTVYIKYPNSAAATPLTITFTNPVARVGAFVGAGKEGAVGTMTVRLYDSSNTLLSTITAQMGIWAEPHNREGFFGAISTQANIKTVTLLNDGTVDYGNALILDTLEWSMTPTGGGGVPLIASWVEIDPSGP